MGTLMKLKTFWKKYASEVKALRILFIFIKVAKNCSEAGESIVKRFQYKMIECSDPNDNTALSEAAAGGRPIYFFILM